MLSSHVVHKLFLHTKLMTESQLILAQYGFPACAWMILLPLAK